jgi:sugar lactone lactonase YvrE
VLSGSLAGQADSLAAVARAKYREAVQAAGRGAVPEARDLMTAAHRAWPTQVAYPFAAARLSARLRDTAATATFLTAIADLGLTVSLEADSALAIVASAPSLASVRTRLEANGKPVTRGRLIRTDAPADLYPEGIDYDPESDRWLVASIRKRTIIRVAPDGRTSRFPAQGDSALDAVLAVRVDPARDLVWATTRVLPAMEGHRAEQPPNAGVVVYRRASGVRLAAVAAPSDGSPHLFGDLTIHPSGDVYLTDSETPVLYRARLQDGRIQLVEVARHRLFRSLQGLAFDRSGRGLYLADYSHGLLAFDLETRTVVLLEPPRGATLLGIDGIARHEADLIAVQNGVAPARVIRIRLDGDRVGRVEVLDQNPVADEPTIGTITKGQFVYVANSQWEKYEENGKLKADARLVAPILIAVSLLP